MEGGGGKKAAVPLWFLAPALLQDQDTLIEKSITLINTQSSLRVKEAVYGKFMKQTRVMRMYNRNVFV